MGPLFERTGLHGVVVDKRGMPVANAHVVLTDVDSGRNYLFAAFTGSNGRFAIPAVRGRRYKIGAGDTLQSAVQNVGDFSREIRIVIDALVR